MAPAGDVTFERSLAQCTLFMEIEFEERGCYEPLDPLLQRISFYENYVFRSENGNCF